MMINNRILLSLATFFVVGFFFLVLPEKGYSELPPVPGGPPCCEVEGISCIGGPGALESCQGGINECTNEENCEFFENAICQQIDLGGSCISHANVPAMSHWGLIALAAVLGIIGIIVFRRKKVVT